MKLQYVFGNPQPKKKAVKRSRARKSSRSRKKVVNIGLVVGGNAMKKGSKEAKAWGRRMKKLRAAGKGKKGKRVKGTFEGKINPRRRRNPRARNPRLEYHYIDSRGKPKSRKGDWYPTNAQIGQLAEKINALRSGILNDVSSYGAGLTEAQLRLAEKLGVDLTSKNAHESKRKLEALSKKLEKLLQVKERETRSALGYKKAGGQVSEIEDERDNVMLVDENPKKKKKKKKHSKRKSGKKKSGKRKSGKRKSSKKKVRRSKGKTLKFRLKRKSRGVRLNIRAYPNPSPMQWLTGAAVAGLTYAVVDQLLVPMIDGVALKYSGKTVSQRVQGMLPAGYSSYARYAMVGVTAIGLGAGAMYLLRKSKNEQVDKAAATVAQGADMTKLVVGALSVAAVASALLLPRVKGALQSAGVPFAGVEFFPSGMSGADFGMYPQLGSSADFGVIPAGMSGIPHGMQGVEYFPNQGMGQVQYYPDGANGDEMYRQSEAGDLLEAEGLGSMDGADFGVIPAGLGEHLG